MTPDTDLIAVDVEQIVLGQLLFCDVTAKAARRLKVEHFGIPSHGTIYGTCLDLWREGTGVDLITVTMRLTRMGKLDEVGGTIALGGFTNRVASPRHLDDHIDIMHEYAALRTLRQAGDTLRLGGVGDDPMELISGLNASVQRATMADNDEDVDAGELAYSLLNTNDKPKPIYLGMSGVDSLVFILPGNMVTIKAAAGVGKTAFVLSAVLNLLPVRKTWFVSLEMSADELMTRALCQLAEVDIDLALIDQLTEQDRGRMAKAANDHAGLFSKQLNIDNSGEMNIDVFRAKAEHKVKNEGVGLIVIDYAQLMEADAKRFPSQVQQLEAISKGIRAAGRTLGVPILCIVHVNKTGDEHGTIQFEKDAHVRLSLEREKGAETMTVDVMKNRNGRVGMVGTPCVMRHGIVGRNNPPDWSRTPDPPTLPKMPPIDWTAPRKDEDAPF